MLFKLDLFNSFKLKIGLIKTVRVERVGHINGDKALDVCNCGFFNMKDFDIAESGKSSNL